MPTEEDSSFGEAAIARGFVTKTQLDDCFNALEHVALAGLERSLPEVMIEKGLITEVQAEIVRRSAGAGDVQILGGFEIIEKIGEGGMGAVYKARQLSMDRIVALKLLPEELAKDGAFTARFLREARIAAKLDHVNIVRGIDVGQDGDTYYFAMEFVEGESVGDILRRDGVIPEDKALRTAIQVARALEHAWQQKLIHRDIKPDNILITKADVAKLADLGLAKSTDGGSTVMTLTGVAVGTPHYMSPEQARGQKDIDIRTDVYSLGATLYHMVTGETPFSGSTAAVVLTKHLTEAPASAHVKNPKVSERTSAVIARMMAKGADERYGDPAELIEDLELVADAKEPQHTQLGLVSVARAVPSATMSLLGAKEIAEPVDKAAPPKRASPRTPRQPVVARPTGKTRAVRAPGSPRWLMLAAAGMLGLLLLAIILWAALRDRAEEDAEPVAQLSAPELLEKEAAEFHRRQLDAFTAGRYEDVVHEIGEAGGGYDETSFGLRIARLGKQASAKAAEERVRREAQAARAHEEEAARLQEKEAADRTRAEAEARAQERARKEAAKRLALERIGREVEAGRWRAAWALIAEARKAGIEGPQLEELSRRAAAGLAPKKSITGPLGVELVLIRGGKFKIGKSRGRSDERPEHEVAVSSFYLGKYEVTQAQFDAFRRKLKAVSRYAPMSSLVPAVSVSWREAAEFCRYLAGRDAASATYRLPTEAEWEFAARGALGRTYPWGSDPPGRTRANLAGASDGYDGLAPVGKFRSGATPEGVMDMVGNAAEWCGDWYGPYSAAAQEDPKGPDKGRARVVRGSAFAYDAAVWSRASKRAVAPPEARKDTVGFRVVRELTAEERQFERLEK